MEIIAKTLRKKCLYLEFFWSLFSTNAEKYEQKNLNTDTRHIRHFFVKNQFSHKIYTVGNENSSESLNI